MTARCGPGLVWRAPLTNCAKLAGRIGDTTLVARSTFAKKRARSSRERSLARRSITTPAYSIRLEGGRKRVVRGVEADTCLGLAIHVALPCAFLLHGVVEELVEVAEVVPGLGQ